MRLRCLIVRTPTEEKLMTTKITKAVLLAALVFGTTLLMFTPPAQAQAAVAYSISFTDGFTLKSNSTVLFVSSYLSPL